jgi:hypothetical protein
VLLRNKMAHVLPCLADELGTSDATVHLDFYLSFFPKFMSRVVRFRTEQADYLEQLRARTSARDQAAVRKKSAASASPR